MSKCIQFSDTIQIIKTYANFVNNEINKSKNNPWLADNIWRPRAIEQGLKSLNKNTEKIIEEYNTKKQIKRFFVRHNSN